MSVTSLQPIPVKFLHVGHHKCGSTFLQTEVFPKIKALRQPPGKRPDGTSNTEFRRAWIALTSQGDGGFDIARVADEYRKLDFNCLSNEAFVGFGSAASSTGALIKPIAERLRRLFGQTNILIVIRNQKSVVPSIYSDGVEYGNVCSFERWIRYSHTNYQLDWFRYAPLIETYQKLFDADRVKVVLFEELFRRETIEEILSAFSVPSDGLENVDFSKRVNPGFSRFTVLMSRFAFRHFGTRANMGNGRCYRYWLDYVVPQLNRFGGSTRSYDFEGYREILHEVYHDDNRRTAELTGLDLARRGYP